MAQLTRADIIIQPNGAGKLQQVLGTTETSPAGIILSPQINKWSKAKPIRFSSYQQLIPQQFAGNSADHLAGYYWGVQVLANGKNYLELHNVTFDYRRPQGGSSSPGRFTDFIGYDHQAVPTMQGFFDSVQYRDLVDNMNVSISIDTSGNNTTGIDIADIVQRASGVQLSTCYPMLLVGEYMCALKNAVLGTVTPLNYQGAWYNSFKADLNALNTEYGLPLGNILVTAFIVPGISTLIDYSGAWVHIGGVDEQFFDVDAFPLPDATGITVNIRDYGSYAVKAKANASGSTTNLIITTTWPDGQPTETTIVEITARVGMSTPQTKQWTFTPGSFVQFTNFTWSSLGVGNPSVGQTVSGISVTIRTKTVDGTSWTNGDGITNGSITIQ